MLFEPFKINSLTLPNRFIRSATWEGMATPDGRPTPALAAMWKNLAAGGVGLIVAGHAYVDPAGQATPWQLGIHRDDLVAEAKIITDAVHEKGGKIALQLAHAGHFAAENLTGQVPWVVSDFSGLANTPRRELTEADIDKLVDHYAGAAFRAQKAGFDAVQIHAAHGYLLSQFLSPYFNRRRDGYGGEIKNRARIILRILAAIRERTGNDFPVFIKINCEDFREDGLSREDSLKLAQMLAQAGICAIEISGGILTNRKLSPSRTGIDEAAKEAYFQEAACEFKKSISCPVILVGGIRSFPVAQKLVTAGTADFLALCRPLIREPGLINRWHMGDHRPSSCISDNLCFRPALLGEGLSCVHDT
jgi:2,4-dienoyl-CoA reductase-like NADH-dependent reductase (Old Yellow Enzyme family)